VLQRNYQTADTITCIERFDNMRYSVYFLTYSICLLVGEHLSNSRGLLVKLFQS